ncbi:uncharacterized protein PADG_12483 [Paracoccidioides brasiliensis Pb18]|uniref:Uncharacterized protein n=1 Tax=Paracoccidioides brasiliensis (strain Pb18) TaxID=502780 RepID=A0A0A0HQC8_PARBD|nr:uncharacterized protein PADG_12483 [Paracoccidioides brasiliensis Pb18]KGM91429.1 hypothetical protein PADG_12483 [Paracoccidioides brasiliensis Pb18]
MVLSDMRTSASPRQSYFSSDHRRSKRQGMRLWHRNKPGGRGRKGAEPFVNGETNRLEHQLINENRATSKSHQQDRPASEGDSQSTR